MAYSLKLVTDVSPDLMQKFAGNERFVTHAHNPCIIDILHQTFGWDGGLFLVLDNENPIGYLSCMIINGRIVSMPHFSFGGLITLAADRCEIYSEILPKIYDHFFDSDTSGVSYLIREPGRVGAFIQSNKVVSWIDIAEKTIEQVIPADQRTKVRKALKNELISKIGGVELLDDFYRVYSLNMLRLGSPVLPQKLFANILKFYEGGDARLMCVYKEKTPVGVAFLMSYRGFFENTWFSTLVNFNQLFPAQLLHMEMISFAIKQCGHTYSFGRSTIGSGVHEFKRRWGTEETIICWNYDKPVKMDIHKAEFLTKFWKLLPLTVANRVGPFIARKIY